MSENKGNNKKFVLIRTIACIISIVLVALGMFKIISTTISMVAACILLIIIALWNAIEMYKSEKKSMCIFNFIMAGIILLLCIGFIITK